MNQKQIEALLGRSLTSKESANCSKYLEIAKEQLETLTCVSLLQESGPRIFTSRDGYSTLFTGIFSKVESVTVDGVESTAFHPAFFDDRNKGFYNSIVFDEKLSGEDVIVTADWGFDKLPSDLSQLIAELFALAAKKKRLGSVKSKRVEDFSVTYGDRTDLEQLVADNQTVISKYGMCGISVIRHGSSCADHGVYDCGYCI